MFQGRLQFSDLTAKQQELLRRMQRLNFGEFHNIAVIDGDPQLNAETVCNKTYRFPGDNAPRPEAMLLDYTLSDPVLEFIGALRDLGSGVVDVIEVRHGLPSCMEVRVGK